MKSKKITMFLALAALLITTSMNIYRSNVSAEESEKIKITSIHQILNDEGVIILMVEVIDKSIIFLNNTLPNGEITTDMYIEYPIFENGDYVFTINYIDENGVVKHDETINIDDFNTSTFQEELNETSNPEFEENETIEVVSPEDISEDIDRNTSTEYETSIIMNEPTYSSPLTQDNSAFEIDIDSNTITGYDVTLGGAEVVIPTNINGTPIYHIDANAFAGKDITSLVIPEGILSIGETAFADTSLTSVSIPSTITTFGEYAFSNSYITELHLAEGLSILGASAFDHNELVEVTFPSSLQIIPDNAFENNKIESLIIPEGVIEIQYNAFQENLIVDLTLPSTLEIIGDKAFQDNWIQTVTIPSNVKVIGAKSFDYNEIDTVILNEGLLEIHDYAFRDNYLKYLEIPSSVTDLGINIIESQFVTLNYYILNNQKVIDLKKQLYGSTLSKINNVRLYQDNVLITSTYDSVQGVVITAENIDSNTRLKYDYIVTNGSASSSGVNSVEGELVEIPVPTPSPTSTPSPTPTPSATPTPIGSPSAANPIATPDTKTFVSNPYYIYSFKRNVDVNNQKENNTGILEDISTTPEIDVNTITKDNIIINRIKVLNNNSLNKNELTTENIKEQVVIYDQKGNKIDYQVVGYEIVNDKIKITILLPNSQEEIIELNISQDRVNEGIINGFWLLSALGLIILILVLWLIGRNKKRD